MKKVIIFLIMLFMLSTTYASITYSGGTITINSGIDGGNSTSATSTSITDSGQSWTTNEYRYKYLEIISGTGDGALCYISSNTATKINCLGGFYVSDFSDFSLNTVTPDSSSEYRISYDIEDIYDDIGNDAYFEALGNKQFYSDSKINIAEGGFVSSLYDTIWFDSGVGSTEFEINGRFVSGNIYDYTGGSKLYTLYTSGTNLWQESTSFIRVESTGKLDLFGDVVLGTKDSSVGSNDGRSISFMGSSEVTLLGGLDNSIQITGIGQIRQRTTNLYLDGLKKVYGGQFSALADVSEISRLTIHRTFAGLASSSSISPTTFTFFSPTLIDTDEGVWIYEDHTIKLVNPNWERELRDVNTGKVEEIYTYNVNIKNSLGSAIEDMAIYMTDKFDNVIVNNQTDINGDLEEVQITYKKWTNTLTATNYYPSSIKFRKYGNSFLEETLTVDSPIITSKVFTDNVFVTVSEIVASGYNSKISINGVSNEITLTGTTTLEELYDYTQYWLTQTNNLQYDEMFITSDGNSFTLDSNWVLINGRYLDTTGTFVGNIEYTTAGTYTQTFGNVNIDFTTAGDYYFTDSTFTGDITFDTSNNQTSTIYLEPGTVVTNSNPTYLTIDNSLIINLVLSSSGDESLEGARVQFYNTNTSTEIVNEIATSDTVTTSLSYTSDFPIRYRVMKANQSQAFEWVEGTATVTPSGMNVNVELKDFSAYNTAVSALDAQGVDYSASESEISINGSTLRVYIAEIDNVMEYGYRIPAYYFWYLTTEDGIRNQDGGNVIWNSAEYAQFVKDGSNILKIKNTKSAPLVIRNINLLPTSGGEEEIFDTSGGTVFINPPIVVPFEFASSSVTEGDKNDIASKVWDQPVASHTDSSTFGGFIQSIKTLLLGLY